MNKFAEILYRNKVVCCYIKELKDKKAKVLLPNNKEDIINTSQIIYVDQANTTASSLIQELQTKNNLREKLKDNFSLDLSIENIWKSISDLEVDIIEASLLLEIFLNRKPSDDEVASFLRKIVETQNYFQFITINTIKYLKPYEVEKVKEKQEKILLKIQKSQKFKRFLEQLIKNAEQDKVNQANRNPNFEDHKYWVENLKNYVLFDKSSEKDIIEEVLKEKNINDIPRLFEILVKNKIVEEDYFYDFSRLGFPEEFSIEENQEAYEISKKNLQLNSGNIENLTHLDTFTIDAEYTKDFDDAISFEKYDDKILLYVHISNVASFINPSSLLFKNSLRRMQTLYLPDKIIPMLPNILSEEKFSLKQNQVKDCVTFKFEIDPSYNLKNFKIFLSKIVVKNRLTYDEVNKKMLEGDNFWNDLYFLLLNFKNIRLQNGAVQVVLPEVSVKVSEDGKIVVKKMEFTRAHELVAEAMILANYHCAKFLHQNQIPTIYRTQSEPYKIIPINTVLDSLNQLKYLKKMELSLTPRNHTGLGLEAYTTVTSPIRRFLDLITQYQLISFLTNTTPLTQEQMMLIIPEIEQNLSTSQYLQTKRNKYFLLKYLRNYQEKLTGIILENDKIKTKVYLEDFNIIGVTKEVLTNIGERVNFKIKFVNPYMEYLELYRV